MNSDDKFVKLFGNCVIVPGYTRSLICDLQKERSHFVPNALYEISLLFENHSIEEIKSQYDAKSRVQIDNYIVFLIKYEFAFYCSQHEQYLFSPISLDWDYPAVITNAIIDINNQSNFDFLSIFKQLENLGCKDVQIRTYEAMALSEIEKIITAANGTIIKSIQVFVKFDVSILTEKYLEFISQFPRITGFFIYAAEVDKILLPEEVPALIVAKIKDEINFSMHCGIVDEKYFTTTIELFTESQNFNSCLNRKISIDVEGNIKNCPSMKESYGNINEMKFEEVLKIDEFKKYWDINKNQVNVCKDCEFRHICTDCRAFLENPNDLYSKPLKCGYDPYTGVWNEWSKNPLKRRSIEYYELILT